MEWTGWLRGSRVDPPTENEVKQNDMYRQQVQAQVKELKMKDERRRRIKQEEEANNGGEKTAQGGNSNPKEPLSIEDPSVEYWSPGK